MAYPPLKPHMPMDRLTARYRHLCSALRDGVIFFGEDGCVLDANDAALAAYRYERAEFIGLPLARLCLGGNQFDAGAHLARVRTGAFSTDSLHLRSDGSTFPAHIQWSSCEDHGEVIVLALVRDMTDVQKAAERLQQSENRFRIMADGLPLMVWVHGPNGQQEFVNRTFCEFFSVTPEILAGGGWQALVHPDDATGYTGHFLECVRQRVPFHAEVRVKNGAGEWRWLESWGRPRFSPWGEFQGFVGASADVTERKEMEEALRHSEAFNRAVLDASPDCVKVVDEEGRLLFMSESGRRMLELESLEIVGGPLEMLAPEEERPKLRAGMAQARKTGTANFQLYCPTRTGVPKWWDVTVVRIGVAAGQQGSGRLLAVSRDVTDRRRATIALRESEENFRAMFEVASVGKAQADPHTRRFVRVNAALCHMVGYTEAELLSMRIDDLTHPDDLAGDAVTFQRMVTGETPTYRAEKRYCCSDGRIVWVQVDANVIRDPDGRPYRTAAVIQDITARKQVEAALISAKERAEAANAAKDHFLAQLSHELRTPLTPVLLVSGMYRRMEHLDADLREHFAMIHRNIEYEALLIDDLLDISRVQHGKMTYTMRDCDLQAIARRAAEMLASDITQKRITLRLDLRADAALLSGDSGRLNQVICNLLKNAVKFTPEEGTISLEVWRSADDLYLCITDSGRGIAAADLVRIFHAFEQVEADEFGPGTRSLGLGLAISQAIVAAHGGRIWAESPGLGKGSSFHVVLPVLPRPTPAASV